MRRSPGREGSPDQIFHALGRPASGLTLALEEADRGPAVDPLSLAEGFQADLAHLEDATDTLLDGQAGESLPVPATTIVRD